MQTVWEDGERGFSRGWRPDADGNLRAVLTVHPVAERPPPAVLERLAHEHGLKNELDGTWAVRPLDLVRDGSRTLLVLEDPGGEPLERLLGTPMEIRRFLRLAIGIAVALGGVHRNGLVHKDLKPGNIMVNGVDGRVRLTGFGIASRLPRERQAPEPPGTIAGTLAYMAPEQTGRMNRSIDSRSDLYALGVTLYQMLTGALPFTATDPMDWVHCHIARTPRPPAERSAGVPPAVSAIVVKLLAKTAEERYQTAGGVERDLRRCLAEWEATGSVGAFPPGRDDTPDRLLIPERLYGREREIETLLAVFDRVATGGQPELVLVSGYSGIGKSAVVNELHKTMVPPRGLFAAGKFDQYKRDVPYATLVQAFQSLLRPLLGESETELGAWREDFQEALGPNARLMVDVIPELKLVIGEPPPVPELPLRDAQRRFQQAIRRFIGVFARPEHPLTLFLDDLQWLDPATLDLLEDLSTRPDVTHLMLIGAYRDNEVDATHPLARKLDAIEAAGGTVSRISIGPLAPRHLGQLVGDALHCSPAVAEPLARLVHEKTAGNPFFVIQFMGSLAEEKMLAFDYETGRWSWNADRIHAKGYADNVVDLMIAKLARLPAETQAALQLLSCLGNVASLAMISIALGKPEYQVHEDLWDALRLELVQRHEGSYRFSHDRVQEAAYSLIPEERRAAIHLRIGRLLLGHVPPERREEQIFEIVNHLNRGAALITALDEGEQLAELDLMAGRRAKASTAYASALSYFAAGAALLAEDAWLRSHGLAFELEVHRAECEFLTGELPAAEERLAALAGRAVSTIERANVACLHIDVATTLGQSSRAVAIALDYLRTVGIAWSPHPTADEARAEYQRIWSLLGGRAIEDLIDLPQMTDPDILATVSVLIKAGAPTTFTDPNLHAMVQCRRVNLSLEHGNADWSSAIYVGLNETTAHFGDYDAGFRFGRLGYDLVERRGLKRFQPLTYMLFGGVVLPWTRHVREGLELVHRAFQVANEIGDLTYAGYSRHFIVTILLTAGEPLAGVQREAETGVAFAANARFGFVTDVITGQLGLIRTLRGLTPTFGHFDDQQFDEHRFEAHLASRPGLALPECWYWIRKLQARLLAGDHASAIAASARVKSLLWTSSSVLELADYHFFDALAHAACCEAAATTPADHLEAIAADHRQLEIWADRCPANFAHRAALVAAEIARIEGRELDAMRQYDRAIRLARASGFVHDEAIADELAARFHDARGFDQIAQLYMRNARHAYQRWGADGKVRQLDELYPFLRHEEASPGPMRTIGAPVELLDLATVINVSQAISSEIVLDRLIDTLMRTAIEQAGAERGLLILSRGTEHRVAAEATTGDETVVVQLRDEAPTPAALPVSMLHYVLRTRESVILEDAVTDPRYSADTYIRRRQARSVLCLPLLNQAKLIGVLYLENTLAPRVFTLSRNAVLKLLASQAAISIENSRLYRDLAEREAKIGRLVDANIVGIFTWALPRQGPDVDDPVIVEVNDAFLRMTGYQRDHIAAGRLRRSDLIPPEWRHRDTTLADLRKSGVSPPFEKEYLRADGSRVPVLVGFACIDDARTQGVAFVLDLTERRQAEAEARENERRSGEMRMQLAHANRLATMGQLTASIAHEVNQPIAAAAANAQAALNWLSKPEPDLGKARQSIEYIIKDVYRGSGVVSRIRDFVKKAPPRKARFDINAEIREVLALTAAEAARNGVALRTNLADDIPPFEGDRVQLQQVVLNLVVNAIEAMREVEGPRDVCIDTATSGADAIVVAVRDSGPGFDPEDPDRIFEAFYTTKPTGLGMGLAICRSIIEQHGGRLWASANLPRGAILQFTLTCR